MNTRIVAVFNRKKSLLGIVLLTTLVVVTLLFFRNSQISRHLSVFSDGLSTCMNRVSQSYSARLLNDSSSGFFSKGFFSATENCIAEVVSYGSDKLVDQFSNEQVLLNNLATDVHWFHEKVSSMESDGDQRVGTVLGNRYSKLKDIQEDILSLIEVNKTIYLDKLASIKMLFYLLGILVPILLLLDYRQSLREFLKRFDLEKNAEEEFEKLSATIIPKSVPDTIVAALDACNLHKCSRLFIKYKTSMDQGKLSSFSYGVTEQASLEKGFLAPREYSDEIIPDDNSKGVNVDRIFASVIDLLSEKLFTMGIVIKMDIDETIEVSTDEEVFEQVLFQALNYSVKSCSSISGKKTISVEIKKLGETLILNIVDSGVGFSKEWLQQESGVGSSRESDVQIEILILKELAENAGCKLFFENVVDNDGVVTGSKVQMILRQVEQTIIQTPSNESELVSIKKGKKRDILKEFEQSVF